MATAGETLLRNQHLSLLNRLRRMGSGKMKLASSGPEKRAVIIKRIMMKARPVTEGVVPKEGSGFSSHLDAILEDFRAVSRREAEIGNVPPTNSMSLTTVREAGKIRPPQDDVNKKLAGAPIQMASAGALARKVVRKTTLPGARAASFGMKPSPNIHTGVEVSKALGSGPSSGGWEHLGEDEAREMLKSALRGVA